MNVFKKANVPLSNIFAMGTDGANTMVGKEKGLFGHMKKVQSRIVSIWCIAHRIHIVCRKSVAAMPVEIHELPVVLYYWFKKSSKRQVGRVRMQEFCGVVQHKLLKPSDTRWLAMQQISDRLSEQWVSLRSYSNSIPEDHELDSEGNKKVKLDKATKQKLKNIKSMLNDEKLHLCYIFLKEYLHKFTAFNQFFSNFKACSVSHHSKTDRPLQKCSDLFCQPYSYK